MRKKNWKEKEKEPTQEEIDAFEADLKRFALPDPPPVPKNRFL